jgi:hypothetical protein
MYKVGIDKLNNVTVFKSLDIEDETFKFENTDNIEICYKCRFGLNYLQVAPCCDCQSNPLINETNRQYFKKR